MKQEIIDKGSIIADSNNEKFILIWQNGVYVVHMQHNEVLIPIGIVTSDDFEWFPFLNSRKTTVEVENLVFLGMDANNVVKYSVKHLTNKFDLFHSLSRNYQNLVLGRMFDAYDKVK